MKFELNKVDKSDKEKYNNSNNLSPKEINETVKKETGEQLLKIREFERKGREQLEFDLDSCHNLTIVFESTQDRDEWCQRNKINIIDNQYAIGSQVKKRIP